MAPFRVVLVVLAWFILTPAFANYLTNADLTDSLGGWNGDGERVYLRTDGTEGNADDKDAVPCIKLRLTDGVQSVTQEYETNDQPPSLHVTVQIYASKDLKIAPFPDDQTTGDGSHYVGNVRVPDGDCWVGEEPSHTRRGVPLKLGQWNAVDLVIRHMKQINDRTLSFNVPPGQGTIYIRTPSVTKQG